MKLVKKSRNRIQGGVTLALFGIVILAGCKPASTQSPAPPTVKVASVTQGDPVIYHEWIATERYLAGKANYHEVLEAQQQRFPAQLNLARTQRDEQLVIVTLYKSLGGGWQENR